MKIKYFEDTDMPYCQCMGRCVCRAFLCGEDEFTGKNYSHRKQWIVDKLGELTAVFRIDAYAYACAYAVMSNLTITHLVLKINHEQAQQLSCINRFWLARVQENEAYAAG